MNTDKVDIDKAQQWATKMEDKCGRLGARIAKIIDVCSGMSMALLVGVAVYISTGVAGGIDSVGDALAYVGMGFVFSLCWCLFLYGARGIWHAMEQAKRDAAESEQGW